MRRFVLGSAAASALALTLAGCGSTAVVTRTVRLPSPITTPKHATAETRAPLPAKTAYKPKHGTAVLVPFHAASGCGVERWSVKTLTDPSASAVNLTPQDATIAQLTAIAPPQSPTDRVAPTETTTYRLSGVIVFAKQEADSDIHLVLEDSAGNTMIIESPSPSCAGGSVVASQIAAVRQAVAAKFPGAAQGQVQSGLSVPVTVTGVGFFDRLHGQTGVAPNGIELHPLTSISFGSAAAGRAPVPNLHLRDHSGTD